MSRPITIVIGAGRTLVRGVVLSGLLLGAATVTHAARLIEAEPSDGTYCDGTPQPCGADVTFARWFRPIVPYWVNVSAAVDAGDPDLDLFDVIGAMQASYQAWEDVPEQFLKFSYQGSTTARIAADGINTTLVYNPALDTASCVDDMGSPGGLLGMTILTEDLPSGEITDADVVLDSADSWAWTTACGGLLLDIQTVLTHEYGHSIGIHHSEFFGGTLATRPTMAAFYFCDPGNASGRSLAADDRAAIRCLYQQQPTHVLMDETGSMAEGNRMPDAQASAELFIDDFAHNLMSVSSFAEGSCPDGVRDGFDLLANWTFFAPLLQAAVASTSPCGITPLWESVCCAVGKASEQDPANLLIYTDTEENSSDATCSADCPEGFCGCTTIEEVLATTGPTDVAVYVVDMTNYFAGAFGGGQQDAPCNQDPPNADGVGLKELAEMTGGLYCVALNEIQLEAARDAIEQHMIETGKDRYHPPDCVAELPAVQLVDEVQVYDAQGFPASPYAGQEVTLSATVTAPQGPFGDDVFYLEDCSGGIRVSFPNGFAGELGEKVLVLGKVEAGPDENRIVEATLSPLGEGALPLPAVVDPNVAESFEVIGSLMRVVGYAEGPVADDRFELVASLVAESPQRTTVHIDPRTQIDPAMIVPGERYIVTGIVGHLQLENELMPRFEQDVLATTEVGEGVPGEASNPELGPAGLMRASYDRQNGIVEVEYTPACGASQHTIYRGDLASVASHDWDGAACSVGTSGLASFYPGQGDAFFVIVGENGIDEGSYGQGAMGERPEDVQTPICDRPQNLPAVICE